MAESNSQSGSNSQSDSDSKRRKNIDAAIQRVRSAHGGTLGGYTSGSGSVKGVARRNTTFRDISGKTVNVSLRSGESTAEAIERHNLEILPSVQRTKAEKKFGGNVLFSREKGGEITYFGKGGQKYTFPKTALSYGKTPVGGISRATGVTATESDGTVKKFSSEAEAKQYYEDRNVIIQSIERRRQPYYTGLPETTLPGGQKQTVFVPGVKTVKKTYKQLTPEERASLLPSYVGNIPEILRYSTPNKTVGDVDDIAIDIKGRPVRNNGQPLGVFYRSLANVSNYKTVGKKLDKKTQEIKKKIYGEFEQRIKGTEDIARYAEQQKRLGQPSGGLMLYSGLGRMAYRFGRATATPFLSPVETVKGVGKLAIDTGASLVYGRPVGTFQEFQQQAFTDPFGTAADVAGFQTALGIAGRGIQKARPYTPKLKYEETVLNLKEQNALKTEIVKEKANVEGKLSSKQLSLEAESALKILNEELKNLEKQKELTNFDKELLKETKQQIKELGGKPTATVVKEVQTPYVIPAGKEKIATIGVEFRGRAQPLFTEVTSKSSPPKVYFGTPKFKSKLPLSALKSAIEPPATGSLTDVLLQRFELTPKEISRVRNLQEEFRILEREKGLKVKDVVFNIESFKNKARASRIIEDTLKSKGGVVFGTGTGLQLPEAFRVKLGDVDLSFSRISQKRVAKKIAPELVEKLRKAGEEVYLGKNGLEILDAQGKKIIELKGRGALKGEIKRGVFGFDLPYLGRGQRSETVPFGKARATRAGEQLKAKGAGASFFRPATIAEETPIPFREAGLFPKGKRFKDLPTSISQSRGLIELRNARGLANQRTALAEKALKARIESYTPEQQAAIFEWMKENEITFDFFAKPLSPEEAVLKLFPKALAVTPKALAVTPKALAVTPKALEQLYPNLNPTVIPKPLPYSKPKYALTKSPKSGYIVKSPKSGYIVKSPKSGYIVKSPTYKFTYGSPYVPSYRPSKYTPVSPSPRPSPSPSPRPSPSPPFIDTPPPPSPPPPPPRKLKSKNKIDELFKSYQFNIKNPVKSSQELGFVGSKYYRPVSYVPPIRSGNYPQQFIISSPRTAGFSTPMQSGRQKAENAVNRMLGHGKTNKQLGMIFGGTMSKSLRGKI